MTRRLILLSLVLPSLLLTSASDAAVAPCGSATLTALPASVPVPEMMHRAPAVVSCMSLQAFTQRLRQPVAPIPAAPAPAVPASDAYVPKTVHDNTPWRFDMNQNGRRMTADEFDAWMKAKGIRIATGKPTPVNAAAPAATSDTAAPAAAPAAQCVPSATVSC
jgi:rare lipoprotein A